MKTTIIISLILLFLGICFVSIASAEWVQNEHITLYPTNEGYISYNSGVGTYTRHSPWTDLVTQLVCTNDGGNNNERIYLEFNISHFLPVDSNITMMNLTYTTGQNPITGAAVGSNWVLISNTNGNSTNTSSPEYLWNAITAGVSVQSGTTMSNWFAPVPELFNRSTLDTPIDANHQGWWLYDDVFGAVGRGINSTFMFNLSNSQDRVQLGYYLPTGAVAASGSMNSSISVLNTSLGASFRGPVFYTNVTFNRSISDGCNFTNSSQLTPQPTVYFFVNNSNGTAITYYVMLQNVATGIWTQEQFIRRASNGTQSCILYNTTWGKEYRWYYIIVNGSSTPSSMYNFSTPYPTPVPPTNIVPYDINSTCINITFTPYSPGSGHTHTVCYYQEGTIAPVYGSGTLGGNVSTPYINISGLTKGTTYTFALWTYWNETTPGGYSALSLWYENITNTTLYGEITVCLRYENISLAGAYNELIDLTNRSWDDSEHRFIVHYTNASSTIYNFSAYTYNLSGTPKTANQTITLTHQPLFYEFIWNYSTYDASNFSSQYTRLLTPYAEQTNSTGVSILTFYLTTDRHVYNQYYTNTSATTGVTYTSIDEDINNLVDYSFVFDDQSGYFNPQNTYSTYASIFTYVGDNKIIIDQRYIDSSAKVNPTLNYHSYYYVGITSTINTNINSYYTNLGLVPTERVTSPYTETIVIYPLSQETETLLSNISYQFGWQSTGFWVHFVDSSLSTSRIMFTVYNVTNGTQYLTTFWVNGTSDYNYTYTTTNPWHDNITYKISINFTYTFTSGVTKDFTMDSIFLFKPSLYHIISNVTFNGICKLIFGASPFYNPSTGEEVQYADWVVLFIGIALLLSFAGAGQPVLGAGSQGIFYLIATYIISGLSSNFIILGVFMLALAVLYAIRLGGRE